MFDKFINFDDPNAFLLFVLGIVGFVIFIGVLIIILRSLGPGTARRANRPRRERRLFLIDAMSLDNKRQLLLIGRDDVEHLICIGGESDLLIESGIYGSGPAVESSGSTLEEIKRKLKERQAHL